MNRCRAALALILIPLTGCGRYGEFTLPVLRPAGGAVAVEWQTTPKPLISRGTAGEWDSVDALNPSIIKTPAGYLNAYSGYDGKTWHTGIARSRDGLSWSKHGRVLSPDASTWEGDYIAANGSILQVRDEFLYWYQANRVPQIGLARSSDGAQWSKHGSPVLKAGPRGSWDERGAADPYVVRFGDTLYMYYLGQERAKRQRLGLARSRDGVTWEKLRSNPVLELGGAGAWDEVGLGEPAVWQSNGSYWMLYTGRDRKEVRRIGLARSQDGVRWVRVEGSVLSGSQAWNRNVVCDPEVEPTPDGVRVWFGGGDQPRPDENLNGQIGLAHLKITYAR